jgi:hypothetical protein
MDIVEYMHFHVLANIMMICSIIQGTFHNHRKIQLLFDVEALLNQFYNARHESAIFGHSF